MKTVFLTVLLSTLISGTVNGRPGIHELRVLDHHTLLQRPQQRSIVAQQASTTEDCDDANNITVRQRSGGRQGGTAGGGAGAGRFGQGQQQGQGQGKGGAAGAGAGVKASATASAAAGASVGAGGTGAGKGAKGAAGTAGVGAAAGNNGNNGNNATAGGGGGAGAGAGANGNKGNAGNTAAKGGDTSGANNNNNNNNGAAAPPVAVNENGAPGPSVPDLKINGGLTLDKSLLLDVEPGGNATAGEAVSATSNNNFISFCQGKTLTNGLQVQGGSCAVTPIGDIPATTKMVSTFFTSPKNGQTIKAGQTFTISLAVQGMTLGSFTNAQADYYAAPQQLDNSGQIVGHAHVTIQAMASADSTALLNPQKFAFFKGLDFGDVNGISSVDVQGGLETGAYRICTIMSNSNHASVIMPVAQRGAENTCSYFTVQ